MSITPSQFENSGASPDTADYVTGTSPASGSQGVAEEVDKLGSDIEGTQHRVVADEAANKLVAAVPVSANANYGVTADGIAAADTTVTGTAITTIGLNTVGATKPIAICGAGTATATIVAITVTGLTATISFTNGTTNLNSKGHPTIVLPFTPGCPVTISGVTSTGGTGSGTLANLLNGQTFTCQTVPCATTNAAYPASTITITLPSAPSDSYTSGGSAACPALWTGTATCTAAGTGTLSSAPPRNIAPLTGSLASVLKTPITTVFGVTGATPANCYPGMWITTSGISGFYREPNGTYQVFAVDYVHQLVTVLMDNGVPGGGVIFSGSSSPTSASGGSFSVGWANIWFTDNTTPLQNALTGINNLGAGGVLELPAGQNNPGTGVIASGVIACKTGPNGPSTSSPGVTVRGQGIDSTILMLVTAPSSTGVNSQANTVLTTNQPTVLEDIWVHGGWLGDNSGAEQCFLNAAEQGQPYKTLVLDRARLSHITQLNYGSQDAYLGAFRDGIYGRGITNVIWNDVVLGPFSNPYQDAFGVGSVEHFVVKGGEWRNLGRSPDAFTPGYLTVDGLMIRDPVGSGAGSGENWAAQLGYEQGDKVKVSNLTYTDGLGQGQSVYCSGHDTHLANVSLPGQALPIASVTPNCNSAGVPTAGGLYALVTTSRALSVPITANMTVDISGVASLTNGSNTGNGYEAVNGIWGPTPGNPVNTSPIIPVSGSQSSFVVGPFPSGSHTITNVTVSGSTVTVTMNGTPNLTNGDPVLITGITGVSSTTSYTVSGVTVGSSTTTFTITQAGASWTSGGAVTVSAFSGPHYDMFGVAEFRCGTAALELNGFTSPYDTKAFIGNCTIRSGIKVDSNGPMAVSIAGGSVGTYVNSGALAGCVWNNSGNIGVVTGAGVTWDHSGTTNLIAGTTGNSPNCEYHVHGGVIVPVIGQGTNPTQYLTVDPSSTIADVGGWVPVTLHGNASVTLSANDPHDIHEWTITSAQTETLPSASACRVGKQFTISNSAASSATLTVSGFTAALTAGQAIRVYSDGSSWQAYSGTGGSGYSGGFTVAQQSSNTAYAFPSADMVALELTGTAAPASITLPASPTAGWQCQIRNNGTGTPPTPVAASTPSGTTVDTIPALTQYSTLTLQYFAGANRWGIV